MATVMTIPAEEVLKGDILLLWGVGDAPIELEVQHITTPPRSVELLFQKGQRMRFGLTEAVRVRRLEPMQEKSSFEHERLYPVQPGYKLVVEHSSGVHEYHASWGNGYSFYVKEIN